jgi:glycosyltransferase involved in cell wall biosynthesis
MHVAQLIPTVDRIAGAERQAMELANGLKKRGWNVSVVALSGAGGAAAEELLKAGIGFFSLHMRKGLADPGGWIQFNRWLRRERPAILHAHLPHAAWLARWSILGVRATLGYQTPAVIDSLHSASTGSLGRRLGYRLSSSLPDRVTAVSEQAARTHLAARMADPRKLVVISNGIDVERWQPDAQARSSVRIELGLRDEPHLSDEFLWLAVGRLEPVKDYTTLLHAIAQLPQAATLLIAGSGYEEKMLKGLAEQLGLENRVRFLGFRTDVPRLMQACDGLVLSSRCEGLPMGLLEAAACALPAVATDAPGTAEVLVDGETGLLAPVGDAPALARTMQTMMQMPMEERRAMGLRARARIMENFGMESVLDRWESLYRELAN